MPEDIQQRAADFIDATFADRYVQVHTALREVLEYAELERTTKAIILTTLAGTLYRMAVVLGSEDGQATFMARWLEFSRAWFSQFPSSSPALLDQVVSILAEYAVEFKAQNMPKE